MRNERGHVGEGLRASRVKRAELFVTDQSLEYPFRHRRTGKITKGAYENCAFPKSLCCCCPIGQHPHVPLAETLGALAHVRKSGHEPGTSRLDFTVGF